MLAHLLGHRVNGYACALARPLAPAHQFLVVHLLIHLLALMLVRLFKLAYLHLHLLVLILAHLFTLMLVYLLFAVG